MFYRYYSSEGDGDTDLGIDAEDIAMYERQKSQVDETDMFDRSEIQVMREACSNPRDRCLFELMANTGQRVTAIQTLRLKDINLDKYDTGAFRLNPEADGLKNAGKNGTWKPLLGAQSAVREWMQYHPTGEPDDYLITQRSSYHTSGDMLTQVSINRLLKGMAEEAGVDKSVHAHRFRHFTVTILKREYEWDDDTIKWYLGWTPGSQVMKTTYQHLSDDDYAQKAEEAAGMRTSDDDDTRTVTPSTCPTCNEPLGPDAKACGKCGMLLTGDAQAAKSAVDRAMYESAKAAETDQERADLDVMQQLIDEHPEAAVEAMDQSGAVDMLADRLAERM